MNKEIIFNGFSVMYSNITSEVIEILSEKYGFDSNEANEYLMKLNNKTKELCMERIEDINFNFEVNPGKKAKKTTQKVKKEVDPNAPKKKRGRPKKSKIVNKEPPVEQFIEPQQVNPRMLNRYATQQEPPQHFNPYHNFYNPQPPPQQPVVNNHYYYGEQEKQLNNFNHYPQEPESQLNQAVQFAQQDDLLYRDDESESEEEYELPPDPRLKFRMAG